uniref:Uncharacterized protein n=1 Tax=Ascaris lumbricoides TaxID=6252 RepID=A0A0M3ICN5_ASCLU
MQHSLLQPMSLAVDARIPPVPPPKPKNYTLQYPNAQQQQQASKNPLVRASSGVQFVVAPGDSDTDSGICADSDNQLSPRRSSGTIPSNTSEETKSKIRPQSSDHIANRDYLTPSSARA